jgi:hypothetical protein
MASCTPARLGASTLVSGPVRCARFATEAGCERNGALPRHLRRPSRRDERARPPSDLPRRLGRPVDHSYGKAADGEPFDQIYAENVVEFKRLPDTPENRELLELTP